MRAMILAAGFGERLRPLTEVTPKPLLNVGGKPLIQYHLENLVKAGITDIVINTSWLSEQIEHFIGDGSRFGTKVIWSRETEPLETGGGIFRALPFLGDDPFLVINGDVWSGYPLHNLVESPWPEHVNAHLVLVNNPAHHVKGDFSLTDDGMVCYPQVGQPTYTFSGISVIRPEIFASFMTSGFSAVDGNADGDNVSNADEMRSSRVKFPLRDVLRPCIKSNCASGEVFNGNWWDVGTVERLQSLDRLLNDRGVVDGERPRG